MASTGSFHCEVEKSKDDPHGNKVTTVTCHGRLVSDTVGEMREVVRPLLPLGGRIVVDLGDLSYMDSSGLGALVGLKVSAVKQGYCILEFANMTPRILQLLRITNLQELLSSS
jgi:anti-sigma B factor antagonist